MSSKSKSARLPRRLKQGALARKPLEPLEIPRPLSVRELETQDPSVNPPAGFPALEPRQTAFVLRRARYPTEPYSETHRAIGSPDQGLPDSRKVRLYLAAIAAYREPEDRSAADLRRDSLRALADAISSGETRDAILAVRVANDCGFLESDDTAPELARLELEELEHRLRGVLESIGAHANYIRTLDLASHVISRDGK